MTSKANISKKGRGKACQKCRDRKRRCVHIDSNTYNELGHNLTKQLPRSKSAATVSGTRRNEDSSTLSDSQSGEMNDAISLEPLSHELEASITCLPTKKKRRNSKTSATITLESKLNSPPTDENESSNCEICLDKRSERQSWKNTLRGDRVRWIRCEVKTCCLWYHLSCVCVLVYNDPRHLLFCPAPSYDRAIFICPKCLEQPKKGYDKAVSQAMKVFIRTIEELKKHTILEETLTSEDSVHVKSVLENSKQRMRKEDVQEPKIGEDNILEFEIAREERYTGFDKNIIDTLLRHLHQSIYDHDIDIGSAIERFGDGSDPRTKKPLGAWELVDPNESIVRGQQWFHIDDVHGQQLTYHAPITAALRSILGTPDGKPIGIASNLKNLPFSQVHISITNWFVFDMLNNEIDICALPNMKSMRAMISAVTGCGESRWPRKGHHLSREVQLRTWYKSEFQQALLLNEENFRQRLEAFLEPLTKGFDSINAWSLSTSNIIQVTLKLWSYLQSLEGRLTMIQPTIGSAFDWNLHEAYDQEGGQQYPGKISEKIILWVLCRGFRYEEDGMEGLRVLTVKARVII